MLQRDGKVLTFAIAADVDKADLAIDIGDFIKQTADENIAAARDAVLDPDFANNGFVYVVWGIRPLEVDGGTRVTRWTLDSSEPPTIDPKSRLDLITYPSGDHIGASLNFAPDGMLIVTTGDGFTPFPPDNLRTAQNLADLRGSVLRIDVRGASLDQRYRIPDDNPFVGMAGARGEIYAFGIRNGFRAAFDPRTDDLWVADVGWERCEMIHRIVKGGNHGWSLYEGPFPVEPNQKAGPGPRIEPAIVMPRSEAQSVTGGVFVPEASSTPSLGANDYLFGCYMNGNVWTADVSDPESIAVRKIARTGLRLIDFFVSSMTEDAQPANAPEILVVDFGGGGIHRLVANETQSQALSFPRRLSESGLFTDLPTMTLADGVIAYKPASTRFRDGLIGQRIIGIANNEPIQPHRNQYPVGTVLANTLSADVIDASGQATPTRIETQVLHFDGLNWNPYTYAWNGEETDADLVPAEGSRRVLRIDDPRWGPINVQHEFVSRDQCATCHHVFNQGSVGLLPENLWRTTATDDDSAEPYRSWDALVRDGFVTKADLKPEHRMVNALDTSFDLDTRARSYLATNCSHCHRPAGGSTSGMHWMRRLSLSQTTSVDVRPSQGDFGLGDLARIIAPGHPERSTLVYRTATTGPGRMPRLGCREIDVDGAKLLWDWIESMPSSGEFKDGDDSGLEREMRNWRMLVDMPDHEARDWVAQRLSQPIDDIALGLYESWIDPKQRTQRVGDAPDIEALLAIQGDAERGRTWFYDSAAAQCRQCHRHRGIGQAMGPDLDAGDRAWTGKQWLHAILFPSKQIAPEYRAVTILSIDGEVWTGLVTKRDDQSITLRKADGHLQTIPIDQIELERVNEKSMMPDGTLANMTPQEVADLLAFLMQTASEKQPVETEPAETEQIETVTDTRIKFGIHESCPVIRNERTRVVLDTDIGGRVLEYSLDGRNALFVSNHDRGLPIEPQDPSPAGRSQWASDPSGGRFDIGPELVTPPRPETFRGSWTAQRTSPHRVRLTSGVAEAVGVRLIRDFELSATSSRLTCRQTVVNESNDDVTFCHWSRTLANGAGITVIPLVGFKRFPNHYVRYEKPGLNMRPVDPAVTVRDDYLIIDGPPQFSKLGFDSMAGWMAHYQKSGLLFVKQFPTSPDRPYIEVAAITIATWTPPTGETIELEPIGPAQTIRPGESASFAETWHLIDAEYPADAEAVLLKDLRAKIDGLSSELSQQD